MTDATRRPGDIPPAEGHRTTPGVRSDATDPGTRISGTREEAGRTTPAPDGESPLVAAHPQRGATAPTDTGAGTHHDGDRTPVGTGTHHDGDRTPAARLLRLDDTDKLTARLQHAVAGFVDAPRDAVQEADRALQELTERFTEAVTERRRTLRRSWQDDGADEGGAGAATDTEQLRLALRDYRELAERLLHA
ncbi:hypothetical protein [Streptomyces sp. AC558_RSS880]|uniref:hypothetical protein n=1 Tax=Streptomyces sp. AC558_RSS880 TaxID=2823687 RepID=UPI001C219D30|nr:hypothetical protein [Streptomyces sp. AC558_RSS880]